ncbi:hypothetical protein METH_19515 [Leisingera methylohalidivorans DSM 14336]|uniref:Uncharacterized protein n=1 Tax=Leisingera methylohalidivorans DSM 14336 TaxID=999552 RepID=V9VZU7_9RHOB|nr:hypothetical protein METH_19515 [Leisingera methylohalidivorans DSM 14336]
MCFMALKALFKRIRLRECPHFKLDGVRELFVALGKCCLQEILNLLRRAQSPQVALGSPMAFPKAGSGVAFWSAG